MCPAEEQHSVAVAAVVVDDSARVLLMKRRDYGHWEPPGGVLKIGESVEQGLRREVKEEMRLEIDVGPLTGVYENPEQGVLSLVFRCRPARGLATATEEAANVRWATPARMRAAF